MKKAYIHIHGNMFLDLQKAKGTHKYIKRLPHPNPKAGRKWIYFYTQQQVKDFKEKGVIPGEEKKSGGILLGIMKFFGFKDEKQASEKVDAIYSQNKKELQGVDKNTFADHMNEYLSNKEKWDAKLNKEKGEKKESAPKTEKPKSDKPSEKKEGGSKWNIGLMRKIAGIVGGTGKEKREDASPNEIKNISNKLKSEYGNEEFPGNVSELYNHPKYPRILTNLVNEGILSMREVSDGNFLYKMNKEKSPDNFETMPEGGNGWISELEDIKGKDKKYWESTLKDHEHDRGLLDEKDKKEMDQAIAWIKEKIKNAPGDKDSVMSGENIKKQFPFEGFKDAVGGNATRDMYDSFIKWGEKQNPDKNRISELFEKWQKSQPDKNSVMSGKDKYKKIASHKNWVSGATITESRKENGDTRFVATIDGWRNFDIYEGKPGDEISKKVQAKVREIRDKLKSGDESVLNENSRIDQPDKKEIMSQKGKGGGKEFTNAERTFVVSEGRGKSGTAKSGESRNMFENDTDLNRLREVLANSFFKLDEKTSNIVKKWAEQSGKSPQKEYEDRMIAFIQQEEVKQVHSVNLPTGEEIHLINKNNMPAGSTIDGITKTIEKQSSQSGEGGNTSQKGDFEKVKDEKGNETWKTEKDGNEYRINKTEKGWKVTGGEIKDGNKPSSNFGLKFADSPEAALEYHVSGLSATSTREGGKEIERTERFPEVPTYAEPPEGFKLVRGTTAPKGYEWYNTGSPLKPGYKQVLVKNKPMQKASQLATGTKIESEHKDTVKFIADYLKKYDKLPSNKEIYESIAKDHIGEIPDYYARLNKMEAEAESSLSKATDALSDTLEKAKALPVGTVSKGRKKVAEGKWVPVSDGKEKNQGGNLDTKTRTGTTGSKKKQSSVTPDKKSDKKETGKPEEKGKKTDDKKEQKGTLSDEHKGTIKSALKKMANILAEALSGRDVNQPTGSAIEQTGENIKTAAKNKQKTNIEADKKKEGNK